MLGRPPVEHRTSGRGFPDSTLWEFLLNAHVVACANQWGVPMTTLLEQAISCDDGDPADANGHWWARDAKMPN